MVVERQIIYYHSQCFFDRLIELSQPACNNVMLVGIVLLLSSVILLGMDGDFIPVVHFPVVCQLRAWLLCLGFTLAFGAMFSKVWRVHRYWMDDVSFVSN